jgi:hypothetical protein
VGDLDTRSIYLFFSCPTCQAINKQPISDVGFGFEMDLTVNDQAACQPFIECNCANCGTYLEKQIGRLTDVAVVKETNLSLS